MVHTLGLYEKSMPDHLTWEQKLLAGKEAGFDFLEMSIDESDFRLSRLNFPKQERLRILEATRKIDMYIDTMCLSGHRRFPIGSSVKEIEAKGMEIMGKAINLAYDIGIRIIQLAAYDVYYNESSNEITKERFLNNLFLSVELAAKNGVILAFETMENDFCNTIEKAMNFVKQVNSPYLKVYPDIGNITNATLNIEYDIETGNGNIVAAHLKETVPNVYRNMKFGTGRVDFASAIKAFRKAGVRKFTAEFWYDGKDDFENQLKIANDYLRPILNSAMEDK